MSMEDAVNYFKMAYGELSDEAREEVRAKNAAAEENPAQVVEEMQAAFMEVATREVM